VPILIHQPSYSILNRWIETELLDVLASEGIGCIAFSALAQGMLSGKYLDGVPADSRAAADGSLRRAWLTDENLRRIRRLNEVAADRGQSLPQMAIAGTLRDDRVTSALIGARTIAQLEENIAALDNLSFTDDELTAIDRTATDAGIDLWARSRTAG
jgi:L-glyceraldehyde 3-phosphate reductase